VADGNNAHVTDPDIFKTVAPASAAAFTTLIGAVPMQSTWTAPSPAARAAALQERPRFRFPLPQLLQRRADARPPKAAKADIITDDFAPADVYDVMGKDPRHRK
jgi:hypothetical protein